MERERDTMNYHEVRNEVFVLYNQGKYKEAIAILENVKNTFPEQLEAITFNLSILYMRDNQGEKSLNLLKHGLKNGIIYPIWADDKTWSPLHQFEEFKEIVKENERLRKEASAKTKPQIEVITPEGYSKEKKEKYPLFIALHGWGDNITELKQHWTSKILQKHILALVQSSQVVSTHGFGWDDHQLGKKGVRDMYDKIVEEYPVDTQKVITGGFSQGGILAMDLAILTQKNEKVYMNWCTERCR